jgi:hypothetical protein
MITEHWLLMQEGNSITATAMDLVTRLKLDRLRRGRTANEGPEGK